MKKSIIKYWYRTEIYVCVICGVEKKVKQRVYSEKQKGSYYYDDACPQHF